MRAISLFAGIGGFDLGFERAGIASVAQVEISPFCRKLLAEKFSTAQQFSDVRKVGAQELPDAEIIVGGWPCQDISLAGRRAGLAGARSGLFYEYIRIITECRPRLVVWENVAAILTSDEGRDFARIVSCLAELGYYGAWRVLDSRYFGVPQRRRRCFGVFFADAVGGARAAEILSIGESLPGYPTDSSAEEAQGAASAVRGTDIVGCLCAGVNSNGYDSQSARQGHLVAKTLLARPSDPHNHTQANYIPERTGVRRLTPLEWERLQGFPDNWTRGFSDSRRYQMIGNAVSVPVAEWLARRIVKHTNNLS